MHVCSIRNCAVFHLPCKSSCSLQFSATRFSLTLALLAQISLTPYFLNSVLSGQLPSVNLCSTNPSMLLCLTTPAPILSSHSEPFRPIWGLNNHLLFTASFFSVPNFPFQFSALCNRVYPRLKHGFSSAFIENK